jgi:hypothetical protein
MAARRRCAPFCRPAESYRRVRLTLAALEQIIHFITVRLYPLLERLEMETSDDAR